MTTTLYVRVMLKEPSGKRCARLGKVFVTNLEQTTDEMCEQALEGISTQMLLRHPKGTIVEEKEFISEADFNAYSHIAGVTTGNTGNSKQIHTIYMKASGLFHDPDNVHGFGVTGPDIPFYLHSAVPYEKLDENEKKELVEHALVLCQNKFSRTPNSIAFIEKDEYLRLVDVIQNHKENEYGEDSDKKTG